MIPQTQQRQTYNGDCLRACIASLLELPIEGVPDWSSMREDKDSAYPIWYIEMQAWLVKRGYLYVQINLNEKDWVPIPYNMRCILIGDVMTNVAQEGQKRKREIVSHAVVGYCDGMKLHIEHDPLPGEREFHGGAKSVVLLVPQDPATMKFTSGNIIEFV